jgi:hypothetical protein
MEFFSMRDDIHHVAAIYHSDHSDHMVKVSSREGGSEQDAGKHAIECAWQDQFEFRGHVETLVGESQHFKHHQTATPQSPKYIQQKKEAHTLAIRDLDVSHTHMAEVSCRD